MNKLWFPANLVRSIFTSSSICNVHKKYLDYTNFPKLQEDDLKEQFVRGSGPGGQSVNKTSNCVVLQHLPTGLVVKCHNTRSVIENRKIARQLLLNKLDNFINKDMSIEAQIKRIANEKNKKYELKRRKLEELKQQWKEREEVT